MAERGLKMRLDPPGDGLPDTAPSLARAAG